MELDFANYLKFFLALAFVLGLFALMIAGAKRLGLGNRGPAKFGRNRRLHIVEAMQLDSKRRVILLRRDDIEHLVLVGNTSEHIIETGIPATGEAKSSYLKEVGERSLAAVSSMKTPS